MPIELSPVQSGYNLSVINDNFQTIENTWDEKLDRLSSTQANQMEQELDMNSNHIINHPAPRNELDLVRLKELEDVVIEANIAGIVPVQQPRQQGDGTTTIFAAPNTESESPLTMQVHIDGVSQRPFTDFDVSAINQITFNEAPPLGSDIDILFFKPTVVGDPDKLERSDIEVDSVAKMKSLSWEPGTSIRTLGYYTPGDGGAARYISRGGSWPVAADNFGNHTDAAGSYMQLQTTDTLYSEQWGATGDATQDFSPIANAMADQAFREGNGEIKLRTGYQRFAQTWTLSRSIHVSGYNKGGNGYDSAVQDRTVLLHDHDGDFIVWTGATDVNSGIGGKISQVDLVQYLGHPDSSNPAHTGGAGTALKFTGTDVSHRAGRIEIDGVAFERFKDGAGSASHWSYNIDGDGTVVGTSNGIRNFYLSNLRFLTGSGSIAAVRLRGCFNWYFSNLQADDEDGSNKNIMIVSGTDAANESTNINISNCAGFIYDFGFCRNVNIVGGVCETYTSTLDTSDVTMTGTRVTSLPTTEQSGVKVLGADGPSFIGKVPATAAVKWGRDQGWGDSTNTTTMTIGNIGENEGDTDLFYTNGTNQAGGMRQKFRNQADNGNFIGTSFDGVKEPSSDNCQARININGVQMYRGFQATTAPIGEYKGRWRPADDNTASIGDASHRPTEIFAVNGSINTSDAREKTSITALTQAEVNASKRLAKEIGGYKWLASIAKKGEDKARYHIGMTVQRAIEIMKEEGLEPFDYGFICYDEWDEQPALYEGDVATPAGNRYGFRYEQLVAFIVAGIEARLEAAGI